MFIIIWSIQHLTWRCGPSDARRPVAYRLVIGLLCSCGGADKGTTTDDLQRQKSEMLRPSWIADCDKMTCHHCRNVFTFVVRRVGDCISFRSVHRTRSRDQESRGSECRVRSSLLICMQHHCRCCGNIFCDYCSQYRRAIPKFDYTIPVRVCEKCDKTCEQAGNDLTRPTSCRPQWTCYAHVLANACVRVMAAYMVRSTSTLPSRSGDRSLPFGPHLHRDCWGSLCHVCARTWSAVYSYGRQRG